jgi:hypothetical protein
MTRCKASEIRRMRDAVATSKEQLSAHPREGERAGQRRRWAFFSSLIQDDRGIDGQWISFSHCNRVDIDLFDLGIGRPQMTQVDQ